MRAIVYSKPGAADETAEFGKLHKYASLLESYIYFVPFAVKTLRDVGPWSSQCKKFLVINRLIW